MAEGKKMHLEVISPERIFYEDDVDMVEFRSSDGDVGIFPDHVPTTEIVAPGVLRIKKDAEVKEAALMDGFVEILKDRMVIMAEACEWPEEIDVNRANEAKIRAERRISTGSEDINLTRAETALRRSLIRIEVAGKAQ